MDPYRDEIDWKDMIRKPEKLFGYSYIYFLAAVILVGLLYLANLRDVGRNSVAAAAADSSALVLDIPLQSPRVIPPVDVLKAGVSTPEAVARGKELFKANCASCHGDNGQGDGPSGMLLNPRPRNFRVLNGWTNGDKVSQMYRTLQEGIVKNGMASFSYLSPVERFALIHYVRSFTPGHPLDSPDELKQIDAAYQLANGMTVPGQIPIRKAAMIVEREHEADVHAAEAAAQTLATASTPGAVVYRRVVRSAFRAATTLLRLNQRAQTTDFFIRSICADPVRAGFEPSISGLSPSEWAALQQAAQALTK